jgi:hypothetical protein
MDPRPQLHRNKPVLASMAIKTWEDVLNKYIYLFYIWQLPQLFYIPSIKSRVNC